MKINYLKKLILFSNITEDNHKKIAKNIFPVGIVQIV